MQQRPLRREALEKIGMAGAKTLLVTPTGSGKTIPMALVAVIAKKKDWKSLVLALTIRLAEATLSTMMRLRCLRRL